MRVLIVSAHFPPNFVGGGTLIPQAIATGLMARGHEVWVFAGWRGDSRPPMDQWDETDPDGVHIRWINSTPWLSDLDDRQFDNPAVTRAFAEYCNEVQPSVINFHSLQGLGAGTIDAASSMGIPTVLTLHDFWWWCGRMFMSDRTDRPCCPVVDCGVCDCSVDAAWLARRNERLVESVESVDRVVCVSSSLARVAMANGVPGQRVLTIENGLPDFPVPTRRSTTGQGEESPSGIRFLYAGGPDPRKGPYVLGLALNEIADLSAWSLTAFGWPDDVPVAPDVRVNAHPPFPPENIGAVLEDADVLLIPSVMRESYSILARQAFAHGVPVVTTDCIGPEEVVVDGTNGLIVPSADPVALGQAMRRIVNQPSLLKTLKPGPATASLRTISECIDDYEKLFEELTRTGAVRDHGRGTPDAIRKVLFVVGITGAPLRYRAYLPAEALSDHGVESSIRHYRHPDVDGLAAEADIVVFYRVPATIQVVNLISGLRARGIPTAFDVDDLIIDPQIRDEIPAVSILPPADADQWMEGVRRYRATLDLCDAFIGSTTPLASHAEALTGLPSFRFPNGVGRIVGRLSDAQYGRDRSPGPLRIGYLSGTITHDHDWQHVEPAVVRLMDDHPSLELWLVGHIEPTPAMRRHAARIVNRPLVHWTELPSVLRDLDVNLAPLAPGGRFNQGKSAIKWLEAAIVGTPTVASPTQPFKEVIVHGENGMLAETDDEWYSALDFLVGNPAQRRAFGDRSRRRALLDLAPAIQAERYLDVLRAVKSNPVPPSRTQTWREVMDDEPSAPFELDQYEIRSDEAEPGPIAPVTMRKRLTDTSVTLREQGLAAAATRVSRYGAALLKHRLRDLKR
jgi:glycosyltransferase involved in cell wall biosynthesis